MEDPVMDILASWGQNGSREVVVVWVAVPTTAATGAAGVGGAGCAAVQAVSAWVGGAMANGGGGGSDGTSTTGSGLVNVGEPYPWPLVPLLREVQN